MFSTNRLPRDRRGGGAGCLIVTIVVIGILLFLLFQSERLPNWRSSPRGRQRSAISI